MKHLWDTSFALKVLIDFKYLKYWLHLNYKLKFRTEYISTCESGSEGSEWWWKAGKLRTALWHWGSLWVRPSELVNEVSNEGCRVGLRDTTCHRGVKGASEWMLVQWSKRELQGVILEDSVELKLWIVWEPGRDMRTGKFGCLLSKERNDLIITVFHNLLLKTYHGHAL